jgi:glycosyltransferase 2 family protein
MSTLESNPPQTNAPPTRSLLVNFIKWTLLLSVLAIVVRMLARQLALIDFHTLHVRPLPLIGAIIALLLVPVNQLISYRVLLSAYSYDPPFMNLLAMAWIPPMGKYLPGASWVGAIYIWRKFGVPATVGLGVIVTMDGLAALTGLMIGSPLLQTVMPGGWVLACGFILGGIVCLHPRVFGRLLNFVLAIARRPPLQRLPDLKHYVIPVLCAIMQWVIAGIALWMVARSVADVSLLRLPRFICIASLGYTIGYLVLFAPAGLGPRDLIFQKAMQSVVVPAAMSAVAVILIRIIQTCTELSAGLVGWLILQHLERKKRSLVANKIVG